MDKQDVTGKLEGGLHFAGVHKETGKRRHLIFIITVVYNSKNHLEKTIKSVLNQVYNNIEYIIIYGA